MHLSLKSDRGNRILSELCFDDVPKESYFLYDEFQEREISQSYPRTGLNLFLRVSILSCHEELHQD